MVASFAAHHKELASDAAPNGITVGVRLVAISKSRAAKRSFGLSGWFGVTEQGTLTLTSFLEARLDYFEQFWKIAQRSNPDGAGIFAPRMLADIEAKRRIIAMAKFWIKESDRIAEGGEAHGVRDVTGLHGKATAYETVLEDLAAVYADHPDYREEWRP